ncbi:hypothetical protein [Roseateles sp. P5_E4]
MSATLSSLANELIQRKRVSFSFCMPGGSNERAAVTVRECEDYDFVEYGEEYKEGEMFEVGPAAPAHKLTATNLEFESVHAAGRAVLMERASIQGEPWHDA